MANRAFLANNLVKKTLFDEIRIRTMGANNELVTQGFFTLVKKLKDKKPYFFGPRSKTRALFFQKPLASGNLKHVTFFSKEPQNL